MTLGEDVLEQEDSPEDVLDDSREVLAWILCLAGCDGDGFCAAV